MKLNYIDALRGIAILSVIWFHCHLHQYSNPAYYSFMDACGSLGALGVQLFYIVSAFTLFLSQNRRGGSVQPRSHFFVRRFFRIAPMYYVTIVYYIFDMAYFFKEPIMTVIQSNQADILANFLLIHGLSPVWINSIIPGGWSVGIEVLFYAIVPFLFTRITNLNRAVLFTALALLFGFLLTAILSQSQAIQANKLLTEYLFYYLPYQLPVFGCGIIAYYIVIRNDWRVNPLTVYIAAGVVVLVVSSKTIGRELMPNLPHTLPLFASIGFALLIIGLSKRPVGLLVNKVTQYMGEISYSAYLLHFGVLNWLDEWLPAPLIVVNSLLSNVLNFHGKYLLVVFVTALLATITYHLIEQPTQQIGKRLLQPRPSQVIPVA